MVWKYTEEQKNYLREIAPGRYNDEITELFNMRFGMNLTVGQIKSFKGNYGISSGVQRRKPDPDAGLFTGEQKQFIRDNVQGRNDRELTGLVNKTFGLSISQKQMRTYRKNQRLTNGLDGQFQKGHIPTNKGTKGIHNVGGNRTSFKKGQRPFNYRPVGTERIDSKDGYTLIKVQDHGDWPERWRHKHVVIWEKAHGAVPDGHKVVFADGDKRNLDLNNLILVSNGQLAFLNKNRLIKSHAELTKMGLLMADVSRKMNERKEG